MTRTFLIHRIAQVYLSVETTGTGVGAKPHIMPTTQFLSWSEAESYFSGLGANKDLIDTAKKYLDSTGNTQLTIERK